MISEQLLKLMTGAIDGELSPAEVQILQQALESNPETCALFGQLQLDSNRLRGLPKIAAPAGLQQRVMELVAAVDTSVVTTPAATPRTLDHTPIPNEPVVLRAEFNTRRMSSRWLPVAAAASVLFAVTTGSFLFFQKQQHTTQIVKTLEQSLSTDSNWAKVLPADTRGLSSAPIPREKQDPNDGTPFVGPEVPPMIPGSSNENLAIAPLPRQLRPDFHGAAPLPETRFDYLDVRVPFLRQLAEFEREDTRQQLTEELGLDPAFRIDLFVRNPLRAVSLLRTAAKASGVALHIDGHTMSQLQKANANSLVIYSETLTGEELSQLFAKLSAEDAKVSPRVFDFLHAMAVSTNDAKQLQELLGFDPGLFKRFAHPMGNDQPKPNVNGEPVGAGTADHIVKSLTAGKAKDPNRSAIVMTWSPLSARTAPEASTELKQFVAKRSDRKANVVPVMIVIRPVN